MICCASRDLSLFYRCNLYPIISKIEVLHGGVNLYGKCYSSNLNHCSLNTITAAVMIIIRMMMTFTGVNATVLASDTM